jgi:hypothetical protein
VLKIEELPASVFTREMGDTIKAYRADLSVSQVTKGEPPRTITVYTIDMGSMCGVGRELTAAHSSGESNEFFLIPGRFDYLPADVPQVGYCTLRSVEGSERGRRQGR